MVFKPFLQLASCKTLKRDNRLKCSLPTQFRINVKIETVQMINVELQIVV